MRCNIEDFIGLKYNRWTIIGLAQNPSRNTYVMCECECGNIRDRNLSTIVTGRSKSCGCLRKEVNSALHTKHGESYSKEYNSWRGMKERCNNPSNSHYQFYGARGITYLEDWESFDCFLRDMGKCPDGFQIDRVDVDLGYSKENCRWVDKTQQAFNIRKKSNNTSGRTGVYKNDNGTYSAKITVYKNVINLGTFKTFEDASKARENAELEYYGTVKK